MFGRRACLELTHNWCGLGTLRAPHDPQPWECQVRELRRGTEDDDSYKACLPRQ